MTNQEIELKFGVVRPIEDLYHSCLSIGQVDKYKVDKLSNTYFDTKDRDLYQIKAGLRIRHGKDFSEQTLKIKTSNLGGLHIRKEYNLPIDKKKKKPSLEDFDSSIFPEHFDIKRVSSELEKQCEIIFERQSLDLVFDDCTFEVCYDRGSIFVGDKTLPIHEFEVEFKDGPEDFDAAGTFYRLSLALTKAHLPLTLEPFSKMHKASFLLSKEDKLLLPNRKYDLESIDDNILNCVLHFESLFGLLMFRKDLLVLGYLNICINILIKYIKLYKGYVFASKYDTYANIEEIRFLITDTYQSLKRLYKCSKKLEDKVYDKGFDQSSENLDVAVEKLRKLINKYDLYNLTLKMRYALSIH